VRHDRACHTAQHDDAAAQAAQLHRCERRRRRGIAAAQVDETVLQVEEMHVGPRSDGAEIEACQVLARPSRETEMRARRGRRCGDAIALRLRHDGLWRLCARCLRSSCLGRRLAPKGKARRRRQCRTLAGQQGRAFPQASFVRSTVARGKSLGDGVEGVPGVCDACQERREGVGGRAGLDGAAERGEPRGEGVVEGRGDAGGSGRGSAE
jgi:hypothetical protein